MVPDRSSGKVWGGNWQESLYCDSRLGWVQGESSGGSASGGRNPEGRGLDMASTDLCCT